MPAAPRKYRICHVSLTLLTGGLERLLVEFARQHDSTAFDLEFVVLSNELGPPAEEIQALGYPVHVLPPGKGLRRLRALWRFFNERRIDLVHTHNAAPHLHATLPARLSHASAVVHTRHGREGSHSWKARWWWRRMGRLADRVVAISHDVERLCEMQGRVPREKLSCIWNGIDLARFPYRGPAAANMAITVGRQSAVKNLDSLLRAINLASAEVPDLRLMLVGDGEETPRLEAEARGMGLLDRTRFLGARKDVPELLAQAGFYVCSSHTEGLSLSLAEAMAVGLPVIATDVGGNGEVVKNGVTGILVPPDDSQALAAAIVNMCQQPQAWKAMGEAGRRRVEEHFSIRGMITAYESLYRELLPRD